MNVHDARHAYKNAQHAHGLTAELVSKQGNDSDSASIEQACRLERAAWRKLDIARRVLIEAELARLGL